MLDPDWLAPATAPYLDGVIQVSELYWHLAYSQNLRRFDSDELLDRYAGVTSDMQDLFSGLAWLMLRKWRVFSSPIICTSSARSWLIENFDKSCMLNLGLAQHHSTSGAAVSGFLPLAVEQIPAD